MLSVKKIRNEMQGTFLARLPNELLFHIMDIVDFKQHCQKQYKLNHEIRNEYIFRKYHRDYYYEYEDMDEAGLFLEIVFL